MARKPNHGLNKHRKEQARKAKRDAKLLSRQQRREQAGEQAGEQAAEAPRDEVVQPDPSIYKDGERGHG